MKNNLIFLIIMSMLLFSSCGKKDSINNDSTKNTSIDSISSLIDNLKKSEIDSTRDEIKSVRSENKTFDEFIDEFIKEVPKSKKYFIDNSESYIQTNDYQDNITSQSESSIKYYNDVINFLTKEKYIIKKNKLVLDEPDILYEFCFRKDKNNNWKLYKIEAGD